VHKNFNSRNEKIIVQGCYIYLDHILGDINSISLIDNLNVKAPGDAVPELIPIAKLNDYLIWREKEFIEKYDGTRHNTEEDTYTLLEAQTKEGIPILASINSVLIKWDSKASHPWLLIVQMPYDGSQNNGLPETDVYNKLNQIEDEITAELKDSDGYLFVGRETGNNMREIYIACKDFRKPASVCDAYIEKYKKEQEITFEIIKDKYWVSLNRYSQ
jgi:hypothetical protein